MKVTLLKPSSNYLNYQVEGSSFFSYRNELEVLAMLMINDIVYSHNFLSDFLLESTHEVAFTGCCILIKKKTNIDIKARFDKCSPTLTIPILELNKLIDVWVYLMKKGLRPSKVLLSQHNGKILFLSLE